MNLLSSAEFIDNVNDYLVNIGLDGTFGQVFLALVIIAGIGVGLSLLQLPRIFVLISITIAALMFVAFGWFPTWLVFVLVAALFGYFIIQLKGGTA